MTSTTCAPAGPAGGEALNTDAEAYGGSGVGNMGVVRADDEGVHGQPAGATLRVPPLGALVLLAPAH